MSIAGLSYQMGAPRPPYIRFEKRAIERRDTAGGITFDDVDFAIVTPHGSPNGTEKIVKEWFKQLKDEVRQERFPQQWLDAYTAAYNAWSNDQDPPINGTAIKNWPSASPAEIRILSNLGIVAVEDLAQANEELANRIGMGARSLIQRARDFVTSKTDTAPLVARLDALERENERLRHRDLEREAELQRIKQSTPAGPVPALLLPEQYNTLPSLAERLEHAQSAANASSPSDKALVDDVVDSELE